MPLIDVEQNSDEWLRMRAGCCTGSRVKEAITRTKAGKYSDKRDHYILETVFGRLTGLHYDHFVTEEMKRGLEMEHLARGAYEYATDISVERVGLAMHDHIKWFCASPDGLVDSQGGTEFKVPKPSTHLEWIRAGIVPLEHVDQLNANMSCTDRAWWDFVSYCPILPDHLQLFIKRLPRNDAKIAEMEKEVGLFLADVDKAMEQFSKNPPTLQQQLEASMAMVSK